MNRNKFWFGLLAFVLPILLKVVWYYNGMTTRPEIATPDYGKFTLPQPAFSTPETREAVVPTGKVILFDAAHTNLYDAGEIQPLVEALIRAGGRVEMHDGSSDLKTNLKYANAFVVISPTLAYSAEEIQTVQKFVHSGGRLLVLSDATRGTSVNYDTGITEFIPDVNTINPVLAPYDLRFNFDYIYNIQENEGNFRNVYFGDFGETDFTADLGRVVLYGAHSIESDSGTLLLLGNRTTFSSLTDSNEGGLAAAALSAEGSVLAIGDFTFLSAPYNKVEDNGLLVQRVVEFLLAGERTPGLDDLPYLFSQPVVSVLPVGDAQLNAGTIPILAGVQSMLDKMGKKMEIVDETPASGDVLVFGTITSDEILKPYLDEFDITLDESAEYIEIPGFGEVGPSGIGLVLFKPDRSGNTLVLLTDSADNLPLLFNALVSEFSTSCVTSGNIAICSTSSGESSSEEVVEETPVEEEAGGEKVTPTTTPAG